MAFDELRLRVGDRAVDPLLLWICVDLIFEVVLSGLSGRLYAHYFISWLPWMTVACALPFRDAIRSFKKWGRPLRAGMVLAAVAFTASACWSTLAEYGQTLASLAAQRGLAQRNEVLPAYVNEHTQPGDTVLVWAGAAGVNFLARRDAPTPHVLYGILVPSPLTERMSAEFYHQIVADPPALILDDSAIDLRGIVPPLSEFDPVAWSAAHDIYAQPYLQQFFDFVHSNYSQKKEVAGVTIYYLNP
jgi:hypothetical protein